MFITVYKYNIDMPAVCRALTDAAEMHRQVQHLFNSARQDFKVLYRLDQEYLLVQSDIKPMCDGIFEMVSQYDMDDRLENVHEGEQIRFRIKAVPRVSEHGKKHYISDESRRIDWTKAQFDKRGMKVLVIREKGKENFKISSKPNNANGGPTCVSTWEYEGVMSITNKESFVIGYGQGIGSYKAYGCGMICLCG
ncbi:type I-E CRISPR-associated protein Cas6/Cse3/CasE [Butyrivibrio sp. AE3006]|uniref:type I-E CRISPR-associated protein Cas6/Cse3/CasE n=1 Tax=Butyrivibrio sp. AE3006 TaxID=1280673 RepID=UPI000414283F|nr:type I-E CRISPR-associated protein Cas6/Cse3/CasE [Butyrivibrio sp. AE3006]